MFDGIVKIFLKKLFRNRAKNDIMTSTNFLKHLT